MRNSRNSSSHICDFMYYSTRYLSPIGEMLIVSDGDAICGAFFCGQKHFPSFENLVQKGVQIVRENVTIEIDDKTGSASGEILLLCPQGKREPFAERNEIIYEYNGNDD